MDHDERVAPSSTVLDLAEPPSPTVNVELKRKVDLALPLMRWLVQNLLNSGLCFSGGHRSLLHIAKLRLICLSFQR